MEKKCNTCVHCSSCLVDDCCCLTCIQDENLVYWEMKTWWEEPLLV